MDDPIVFDDPVSIRFGSFLGVDGGLTGVAGATGSIDDPVFLATPRHPGNRWGWHWDALAATPGDGPELFSDGFE